MQKFVVNTPLGRLVWHGVHMSFFFSAKTRVTKQDSVIARSLCIPNFGFTKNHPQVFKNIWKHCHPLRVTHPRTLQAICSVTCTANSQFNRKVDH